jgi:hypothetical protein
MLFEGSDSNRITDTPSLARKTPPPGAFKAHAVLELSGRGRSARPPPDVQIERQEAPGSVIAQHARSLELIGGRMAA